MKVGWSFLAVKALDLEKTDVGEKYYLIPQSQAGLLNLAIGGSS